MFDVFTYFIGFDLFLLRLDAISNSKLLTMKRANKENKKIIVFPWKSSHSMVY